MDKNESDLFKDATNPKQYDSEALYWQEMGAADSPTRQFFKSFIFSDPSHFQDQDILDIGSGTGWLLEEMKKIGAKSVIGIEPSQENVELAHRIYPEVETILSSLETYEPIQQFDVVTSVMVMVHIANVDQAMSKISELLKPRGELHLVIPPYEYTKTPRFYYELQIEDLNEDEYVAAIKRPNGTITDVVRKRSVYVASAKKYGLRLLQTIEMKPDSNFLKRDPKYIQFKDKSIADYLVFKKE